MRTVPINHHPGWFLTTVSTVPIITQDHGYQNGFITFHAKGETMGLMCGQLSSCLLQGLVSQVRLGLDIINKYPPLKILCILSGVDPDGWAAGGAWDAQFAFRNTEYYASYVQQL